MLTAEQIKKLISRNDQRQLNYARLRKYFSGDNPTILDRATQENPDNRIPVPFIRKALHTLTGYLAKPGSITFSAGEESASEKLNDIFKKNDADLETNSELFEAMGLGESFELHYFDEFPQFAQIRAEEGIAVYDSSLKPVMTDFVYYYKTIDTNTDKTFYNVFVYDTSGINIYQSANGWAEGTPEEVVHSYKAVPVVHYRVNDSGANIFSHVTKLVDQYDKIISEDVANELERFANAYLKLSRTISTEPDEDGNSDLDKIKELRVFDGLEKEDIVEFLTKTIQTDFIEFSAKQIERLIYEMLHVVNFNDKDTFSATSGYALRLMMLDMEFAASVYESFFTKGLKKRIELVRTVSATVSSLSFGDSDIAVSWSRNLPGNETEEIDNVLKMYQSGLISEEKALNLLPGMYQINPATELEKTEEETQVKIDNEPIINE